MAVIGGAPLPVTTGGSGQTEARPAVPVYVVSGVQAPVGGRARRVVVVTSGPVEGGAPIPVYDAGNDALYTADAALPVYVVSGSLGLQAPVNTVLPVISGSQAILSTTNGTWTNTPSGYTYQWKRNGVNIGGATNSTYTITSADIGATLTVTVTATNASGSTSATSAGYTLTYTQKMIALLPIAYWPMAEAAGSVATDESGNSRTGAYTAVTLGATGIGDGRTAATFDGSTSFNNIFTASLQSAFNGQEGTAAGWAKVSAAGAWTDATFRETIRLFVSGGANLLFVRKSSTSNTMQFQYVAGGTTKTINVGSFSPTTWFHWALTWSKANDQMIAYLNGAQVGSIQTGLGTFTGSILNTASVVGSSSTTPAEVWSGTLAHTAIWTTPLSAAQVLSLATVP